MTGGTSERRAHRRGSFHGAAPGGGGRRLAVQDGGQNMGGCWGGINGAKGQPVKLDGERCPTAGEKRLRF
jgi:hypothetical protein